MNISLTTDAVDAATTARPTAQAERAHTLDILRGVALLVSSLHHSLTQISYA